MRGAREGAYRRVIDVYTKNKGKFTDLEVRGEFQEPKLEVLNPVIVFEDLCVEKEYKFSNDKNGKLLKISNPNKFDVKFKIEFGEDFQEEIFKFKFHPRQGILAPGEKKKIRFKTCVKEVGNLLCPFELSFEPYLLSQEEGAGQKIQIKFQEGEGGKEEEPIPEEHLPKTKWVKNYFQSTAPFLFKFVNVQGIVIDFLTVDPSDIEQKQTALTKLEFEGSLMEALVRKVFIKNNSDLDIPFELKFGEMYFEKINSNLQVAKDSFLQQKNSLERMILGTGLSKSQLSFSQPQSFRMNSTCSVGTFVDSGQMIEFLQDRKFNFKSLNGKMYQKQIHYTKECTRIQKRNRDSLVGGISLPSGLLKANSTQEVTVVAFGASPMDAFDKLVFTSSKAERKEFPVKLTLNGLKFNILDSQVGLKHQGKNVSYLSFGDLILWDRPVEKVIKLRNKSDKTLKVFCELFSSFPNTNLAGSIQGQKKNKTRLKLQIDSNGKAFYKWGFRMRSAQENSGFEILNREILIPPNSTYPLKVRYVPFKKFPVRAEKEECVLGMFESRPEDFSSNFVAVKLLANRIEPEVVVAAEPHLKTQNPSFTFYKQPGRKRKSTTQPQD